MKKETLLKAIGGIWFAFWLIGTVSMISTGDTGLAVLFFVFSTIGTIPIYKYKEKKVKEKKQVKAKKQTTLEQLYEEGFNVDKSIKIGFFNAFYVDDKSKKFAVKLGKKLRVFNYSDLGAYELNEDGNSIIKGKGLATAVGGMAFGLLGAMVGGSGKKKTQSTCTSLIVRIMVNDLNEPQITFPYINTETKKNSLVYKTAYEEAKNLIATLTFIENNNGNQ